jgi:uncharacterized protein YeaO (DUF488 family)
MGKLRLSTFQIGTRRRRGEGLRIGTVRFLPRGVYKKDWARLDYFDVWLPTIAPSRELLDKVKHTGTSLDTIFRRYEAAMRKTEPWQTIVMLAELAKRTPIAIGCYCEDQRQCHRHVLERLIREAARASSGRRKSPKATTDEKAAPFFDQCVYTIRHPDDLAAHSKMNGSRECTEKRRWVNAAALARLAKNAGKRLPLLFADATNCSRLIYWATLEDVRVTDVGTRYKFSQLTRLPKGHSPQELILTSKNKPIDADFIRPYAICYTPNFLKD